MSKTSKSFVKFRCKALQCLHGSADRDYAKRLTTEKEPSVDISNSKHGAWAFFKGQIERHIVRTACCHLKRLENGAMNMGIFTLYWIGFMLSYEKLSGIIWTPIRYVTLHLRNRRGAATSVHVWTELSPMRYDFHGGVKAICYSSVNTA